MRLRVIACVPLVTIILAGIVASGCAGHRHFLPKGELDENGDVVVTVTGQGVAPPDAIHAAHGRILAKRAAEADAYRQLAEKIYGLRVFSKYGVSKNIMQEDKLKLFTNAYLEAAEITEVRYTGDSLAEVDMELRINHLWFHKANGQLHHRVSYERLGYYKPDGLAAGPPGW